MADLANVTTPTGGDTPAPSAPTTPAAPAAAVTATPQTAPVAAPTPQPSNEGMVPSYRIRETREAAIREANEQFARREAEYTARLEAVQRQLHAVVGVTPPADPEIAVVRDQFSKLYPGLSKIEERAEQLLGVLERSGDLEAQTNHYWQSYGRQTMGRLFERAQESLGTPLTEEGKRQLHAAFTGYVSSSPELTGRYANDPTLVDDFWKAFTSSFIDPSRRVASAAVVDRTGAPLPSDTPSGAPRVSALPKLNNMDERAAQGWASYQATAKK